MCVYTVYIGLGEILAAEMRNHIMLLDGAMGSIIQCLLRHRRAVQRYLSTLSFNPSCFDFVSVQCSFISFLYLLTIQVKSSRIIPRVYMASMVVMEEALFAELCPWLFCTLVSHSTVRLPLDHCYLLHTLVA